jgi:hypothetical protein
MSDSALNIQYKDFFRVFTACFRVFTACHNLSSMTSICEIGSVRSRCDGVTNLGAYLYSNWDSQVALGAP